MTAPKQRRKPVGRKTPGDHRKANKRLKNTSTGALRRGRITDEVREHIRQHAREGFEQNNPPQEVCGFIATDGKRQMAFRSPNRAANPHEAFRTCPKAWRHVENKGLEIIAVYHSHVNEPPVPSPGDKTESEANQLPFIIIGWPADAWDYYAPKGWKADLIGRPFIHGILDCYTEIKDYYEVKLKIELPDFEREDEWWLPLKRTARGERRTNEPGEIIAPPKNLYFDNFKKAGFVEVSDLREHDVLLMQLPLSPVINHAGIYTGDGQMLHHRAGRISKIEPYLDGHGYARMVQLIVRYKSLL